MPARLVLALDDRGGPAPADTGPLVHAAFLAAVQAAEPGLAERLHRDEGPSPFALSPLLPASASPSPTSQGRWRVEVGVLVDDLLPWVVEALDGVDSLRLGNRHLDLVRIDVFLEPYEELLQRAEPQTAWRLQLLTPAVVRLPREPGRPRRNQVLPLPDLLLAALARRWERCSPVALGPVDEAVEHHVVVARAELRTTLHVVKAPATRTAGSMGKVEYRLVGQAGVASARRIDALWRLARYAGVGDYTTKGMGVVRLEA